MIQLSDLYITTGKAIVWLFSPVWLFVSSWTAACQASLSFTIFWSLLKLMSIESVMPSNHLICCLPLLLLPSIFPSITVWVSPSHQVAKGLELQHQSFQWILRTCNEYSAQENKICHSFHHFPIYLPWSDGSRCHDVSFWMLSFKPAFSLFSFTFIKRLFSSPSLSAIRAESNTHK